MWHTLTPCEDSFFFFNSFSSHLWAPTSFLPPPPSSRIAQFTRSSERLCARQSGWHDKMLPFPATELLEWKYDDELTSGLAAAARLGSAPNNEPAHVTEAASNKMHRRRRSFLLPSVTCAIAMRKQTACVSPCGPRGKSLFTNGESHQGRCATWANNSCRYPPIWSDSNREHWGESSWSSNASFPIDISFTK